MRYSLAIRTINGIASHQAHARQNQDNPDIKSERGQMSGLK